MNSNGSVCGNVSPEDARKGEEINAAENVNEMCNQNKSDELVNEGCEAGEVTKTSIQSEGHASMKVASISMNTGVKDTRTYAYVDNSKINETSKGLLDIPTEIDNNGNEVVIFDDVMVAEGSKKWVLTLCGYFVGHQMPINELRYNLRRMWSRYRFKDIIDVSNGVYYMKFHSEEGLNLVFNNGPWMVRN